MVRSENLFLLFQLREMRVKVWPLVRLVSSQVVAGGVAWVPVVSQKRTAVVPARAIVR